VTTTPDDKRIVYLVGAGPGRADLITLRGAELIKIADCIIYDKLANPDLLRHARADAEIVHVPKRTGGRSFTQDQINELLLEKARKHKCVVRLKGGDPCIFGRCSEEAEALADVYLELGGGCQGCGMARVTLKQGVEKMLREAIPDIGEIHDITDHAAGADPYYASR